jgi:hypothetical protein
LVYILLFLAPFSRPTKPGYAEDYALKIKSGVYGSWDGQFNYPCGIAVDSSGSAVNVTDATSKRVQNAALMYASSIGYGFDLRGGGVPANTLDPLAVNCYPNAWQLLTDLGVNWIRVSGGVEGDINHFNIKNHPDEWAQNLDSFLAEADSHGVKVSFVTLGNPYETLFGIRSPGYNFSSSPTAYTPMNEAKAIIDQLAGNNSLAHDFISDPRVLGWVTSNEVYIGPNTNSNPNFDGPFILNWNLELCDYIRSKGGRAWMASPTVTGSSDGYDFAQIIPLIGGHVDFLEAHYYEEYELLNYYMKPDETYDWAGFENHYKNLLLDKMVNVRGNWSLDDIFLGEFGMWIDQGNDLGVVANFTAQDRNNYYQAVLSAARDAELMNVCQHEFFEQRVWNGTVLNRLDTDYGIVSFDTKTYFPEEAADVLREAYGGSSITISVTPNQVTAGSNVTINGAIVPTKVDVNVTISYRLSGELWNVLATVKTDSDSDYTYTWKTMSNGTYEIQTVWQGDEETLPAKSSIETVLVTPLDVGPPTTAISLSGAEGRNGWFTSDVDVALFANDDISGVEKTEYSFDNITWTTYSTSFTITNEGTLTVYYKSIDKAGNVERIENDTIKIDKIIPSGSINLNNGDAWTTSNAITMTLTATDVTSGVCEIRFSNDGVWDTEPWEAFSPTKAWTLTQGDGTKTVYCQIKDIAGLVSVTYSHTIILDTAPPQGSIKINDGIAYTATTAITLTLSATDATSGVAEMRFSNDNNTYLEWQTFTTSKIWILQDGDDTKTVYVQYKDNAGLISSFSDSIILDTTKPVANAGQNQIVNLGETVSFDAGASSDNVGIVSYEWNFGDGTIGTGKTTIHTYANAAIYTVTLAVKDAANNTATYQITITVLPAEAFPMWIVGAAVAAAIIAVATTLLLKKRKTTSKKRPAH